jgi:hypothetical protein
MARIRHGYTEIAPILKPYFTTATHDDIASVIGAYGTPSSSGIGLIVYALTTSGGMIGLITSMVGGFFVAVIALIMGVSGGLAAAAGVGGAAILFLLLLLLTFGSVPRHQETMSVLFPAPEPEPTTERRTAD